MKNVIPRKFFLLFYVIPRKFKTSIYVIPRKFDEFALCLLCMKMNFMEDMPSEYPSYQVD
jgi:hypothetical protein